MAHNTASFFAYYFKDESAPAEVKTLLGDVMARRDTIKELYKDESLNEEQDQYVVATELVANMAGDLLSSPYFVERMGARNDSAWKRFVTALKVAHDGKAGGISKSSQKYLSGLYKAYVRAVDDAGHGVKISSIVDEEEKEKALAGDSVANERGSRQKRVRYISFKRVGTQTVRQIRAVLEEMYDGVDGVADGIAVAVGETVYIVDSGCENGEVSFGIRRRKTISDERLREDYTKERNNDAISKGHVSDGLSQKLRSGLGRYPGSDMRRESGAELQADPGESRNNGGGAVEQTAGNRGLSNERKSKKASKAEPGDNFKEDKYYARQIDNWKNLKDGGFVTVGEIANESPLNLVGVPSGTLYFDSSKILKALSSHNDHLSVVDLKSIPVLLDRPIVITEYKPGQKSNTVSVYGNLKTASGTPIVVGVVIAKGVNKNIITKIRTVHARGDFERQITNESVLYLSEDKKETKTWFRLLGIDVPLEGNKFGFIRSISHSDNFVNRKNSDERHSKQKVYPKRDASAIIDEVVSERLIFDDVYGEMKGKTKKEATSILWKALNTAEEGRRTKAALDVADFVLDNAVVKTFGEDPSSQEKCQTVEIRKDYSSRQMDKKISNPLGCLIFCTTKTPP